MVTLLDFILLFFLFTEKLLREGFCTDLLVFFGKNDAEAETPVLWPPHLKSWLTGKDSCTGRDWGQEEKVTTEDEMAGWHHRLDGRESEWTPGVGDGQGGLACCNSWGRKESDTTERLNWTESRIREPNHTGDKVPFFWKSKGSWRKSSKMFSFLALFHVCEKIPMICFPIGKEA